jgi:two-component system OmpR family response regulator
MAASVAGDRGDTAVSMISACILVLEDDGELRSLLVRGLAEEGFRVSTSSSAAELLAGLESGGPADALVVDIGLPDADGRDVVQALRARGVSTPVLFLTARDALPDRLAGFAAGGDDYLTKPFAFAELVARLRALVRRGLDETITAGRNLLLDPGTHTMTLGSETVSLTPTEFRLLARLASEAAGALVRRRELVDAAWPHGAIVHDNTLDVYIARLRRKLAQLDGAPRIVTTHGVGYGLR